MEHSCVNRLIMMFGNRFHVHIVHLLIGIAPIRIDK